MTGTNTQPPSPYEPIDGCGHDAQCELGSGLVPTIPADSDCVGLPGVNPSPGDDDDDD